MNELYDYYKNIMEDSTPSLFDICTKAETQIDSEATLKTFKFIDKSISIDEEITQETAKEVVNSIRFWNSVDEIDGNPADPITIFINTPGGDLNATFSIIAAMQMSNTPIYTVNAGRAWSGGFFILIAGKKRFAVPYASYLFHEGSCVMIGDAHKALQEANYYKSQLGQLKEITLENTSIGEELYEKHRKDDWWFGNKEALKYNVIDSTLTTFNFIDKQEDEN